MQDSLEGHTNWISRVKKILDDYGFSDIFVNSYDCLSLKHFQVVFKTRMIDCFKQEWFGAVSRNGILD
jgi:hypothetical protein